MKTIDMFLIGASTFFAAPIGLALPWLCVVFAPIVAIGMIIFLVTYISLNHRIGSSELGQDVLVKGKFLHRKNSRIFQISERESQSFSIPDRQRSVVNMQNFSRSA